MINAQNQHIKEQYHQAIETGLNNEQLRTNLLNAMDTLRGNRKKLIQNRYTDWDDLRKKAKELKQKTCASSIETWSFLSKMQPEMESKCIGQMMGMRQIESSMKSCYAKAFEKSSRANRWRARRFILINS